MHLIRCLMTYLYQVILPLGYTYYATHFYDNDVLETVYWKQGEEYQERSGRWVTHTMVFRMSYSMDTVWPEEYIPWEIP